MKRVLTHPTTRVEVEEIGNGTRRVTPSSIGSGAGDAACCETTYPVDLIAAVLDVKGRWVCDEIRRDEDEAYVKRNLEYSLLAYLDKPSFRGMRLLDLGCGCGASSINLKRLLGDTTIVGIDIVPEFIELARKRAEFHEIPDITFEHSPDGQTIPDSIGQFDFIVMSAVHEHLLPNERNSLLPVLWDRLRPGGVLFVNQLPHRYSPFESHTTGLPFLNYLPRALAHWIARSFSRQVEKDETWEALLRRGIRGGTANEIVGTIAGASSETPELMEPHRLKTKDRIDLWYALSSAARWPWVKRAIRGVLKVLRRGSGVTFVPDLSLAIRKAESRQQEPVPSTAVDRPSVPA